MRFRRVMFFQASEPPQQLSAGSGVADHRRRQCAHRAAARVIGRRWCTGWEPNCDGYQPGVDGCFVDVSRRQRGFECRPEEAGKREPFAKTRPHEVTDNRVVVEGSGQQPRRGPSAARVEAIDD